MAEYQLTSGTSIIRETDGASIPNDPRNADWQQYQIWLAANNTPDPATTPTPAQAAQETYNAAIASGLTVSWATSVALSATYLVDQAAQNYITSENVSILVNNTFTNGQATRNWPDKSGAYHNFTVVQFKAFATQVALYVDALIMAMQIASTGQSVTWPSAAVTINL